MQTASTRKCLCRSATAQKKRMQRHFNYWNGALTHFDLFLKEIKGKKGTNRSFQENCLIICALRAALKWQIEGQNSSSFSASVNWTAIKMEVAWDFLIGVIMYEF